MSGEAPGALAVMLLPSHVYSGIEEIAEEVVI